MDWVFLVPVSFVVVTLVAAILGAIRLLWCQKARYEGTLDVRRLRKGDIILTGKQPVSHSYQIQLANILTRKPKHRFWTHAAIYQGDGLLWEAQAKPNGVRQWRLDDYIQKGYYLRAFRHKYLKDEAVLDRLVAWCASQVGDGYDMRGVIFYALSIVTPVGLNFIFDNSAISKLCQVQDNFFCSELVVEAFNEVGHPISPFDAWRVKPTDFIGNPVLEEVA
ncbi:MAG: hypothetical protein HY352_02070 [Candidatus Omnitrophica bacterium]|nr:hypothetical protein [Candidatus Omnitrophota bacterium]